MERVAACSALAMERLVGIISSSSVREPAVLSPPGGLGYDLHPFSRKQQRLSCALLRIAGKLYQGVGNQVWRDQRLPSPLERDKVLDGKTPRSSVSRGRSLPHVRFWHNIARCQRQEA